QCACGVCTTAAQHGARETAPLHWSTETFCRPATMSIATVQTRYCYGLKGNVANSVTYLDERNILYPSGVKSRPLQRRAEDAKVRAAQPGHGRSHGACSQPQQTLRGRCREERRASHHHRFRSHYAKEKEGPQLRRGLVSRVRKPRVLARFQVPGVAEWGSRLEHVSVAVGEGQSIGSDQEQR
ncbi:hypothetical protein GBAR_LOCUS29762, partial [Geodia barretti]